MTELITHLSKATSLPSDLFQLSNFIEGGGFYSDMESQTHSVVRGLVLLEKGECRNRRKERVSLLRKKY